ncbi:AAA family ATPase [Tepidiforma thermophila]|uniref:Putative ATP-dependent endonuclease of OLD family n=1 Tax=Tepidiforma thermophila (strain KCTC 52669 / CGMCC 1.13589 / G233) TaxID=2761530 RepID=A0A2A9HEX5_TEPT2|nr:AAA family ATPase [Tepidiforma thermophila]PFG73565.1 putative ATP-dependent endonuclease of OLD family [Tepidiforma thermophila]
MLTRLAIRNFKLFESVEIELGERVVFVGPNNSGKTSALQALALWHAGVRRWVEKRGAGNVPKERAGVTINRKDLIALPVPAANLLWRDLHVREGYRDAGRQKTRNVLIEIDVDGMTSGAIWTTRLEFDYANEESFYCRSRIGPEGTRYQVPAAAAELRVAYLPPMSGLAANETRLDPGAIDVRIGEGRTAEVLRNLCWRVFETNPDAWRQIVNRIDELFGVTLGDPAYIKERGEVVMSFRTKGGVTLDLSASGRGQQQTLLLLAHMAANPGAVLLLDEPDAHLEILRQRQIYRVLAQTAEETGSQVIAASHSEVILNEAADRDIVVAFVGRPHRIDDRGSQILKALKEIGFDQYLQAELTGWVLYLEGATDLAILRAFAEKLDHPARELLERPFVYYVGNQPPRAQEHFHALREAKPDLAGVAIYDRLEKELPADPYLRQEMWRKREIENYLCQEATLLAWAEARAKTETGPLWGLPWREAMEKAIGKVRDALASLGKPGPDSPDLKASDEFLDPVFKNFFAALDRPNLMRKTDYHTLAPFVPAEALDDEVREKLDAIVAVARSARPEGSPS